MATLSTGLELILNACENVLQIEITDNEKPLCYEEWHLPKRSSEILSDAIAEMCRRLGIKPSSFRRIACMAGPGSFTGIRLVLATASALRRSSRAQLASLDYLQAIATSAVMRRGLLYSHTVYVVTYARRNLVHFQQFTSYGPQIPALPVTEVSLVTPQETLTIIGDAKCLLCGSGISRNADTYAQSATGAGPSGASNAILLPDLINPDASALRLLARHGDYFPRDVSPKYVRPCDAMENLEPSSANLARQYLEHTHADFDSDDHGNRL